MANLGLKKYYNYITNNVGDSSISSITLVVIVFLLFGISYGIDYGYGEGPLPIPQIGVKK